jgi:hypothetical protein
MHSIGNTLLGYSFTFGLAGRHLSTIATPILDMSTPTQDTERIDYGTTLVELAKRRDGTWEAIQQGLDVVGTGPSAARATADMASQITDLPTRLSSVSERI